MATFEALLKTNTALPVVVMKDTYFSSIKVSSWAEFIAIIEAYFLDWPEYIYRGQHNSEWPLRSKFDREFIRATEFLNNTNPLEGLDSQDCDLVQQVDRETTLDSREKILYRHLERFQRYCLSRRGSAPSKLSEDEYWALGQHFGLATPLLDWSRSPYVACFFAMQEKGASESEFHAVWAFSHLNFS